MLEWIVDKAKQIIPPTVAVMCSITSSVALSAAPALGGTQWAKVNGVQLRYELSGKGADTVVLLHEMGTSLETWDYVLPEISRSHSVLRYDLRGFGLSERVRAPLSMEDEMGDLRALLEALNIRGKVTLIGGAVGGAIALSYAATYPDQVKAVVAISPAAYLKARMSADGTPIGPGPNPGPGAGGPSAGAPPPLSASAVIDQAYPVQLQKAHPERFARFLAIQAASDPAASVATTPAAYKISYSEVLPKIKCPALIVATSLWMRTPESFKELADAIPGSRFEVLETGHYAPIESPELVTPVLTKFLKETSSAKR